MAMTRLRGTQTCSFRFSATLRFTESRGTMVVARGGGWVRLLRRRRLIFALSATMVIAAIAMQVVAMAALRPLSVPAKVQKPEIFKSAPPCAGLRGNICR